MERGVGEGGTASFAYAGAGGRHLLRHEAYSNPASGALERLLAVTAGASSYQALQFRDAGAFAGHFFASVSYAPALFPEVILVEGLFDYAVLWKAGFRNVTDADIPPASQCPPGKLL